MKVRLLQRIRWWRGADRIGPDIPTTHWMLHFPELAERLCKRKFAAFGVGSEFRPGAYAVACSQISIGENVTVRPGTVLCADPEQSAGRIIIEDDVLIGVGVHVYTTDHAFEDSDVPIRRQAFLPAAPVVMRSGCWIGANAILLPGVTVGRNSVVGAGSIVTRDIPDFVVAVGNPCRVVRKLKAARDAATGS